MLTALLLMLSNPAAAKHAKLIELEEKLAQHQGQVVYLDFWASWCIPCKASFPWMNAMQAKYQAQGLKIITVNLDADKAHALDFLAEHPADFEVIYDPKGKIARHFNLPGMPSSMIFDRQGKLVATHVGFNDVKKVQYQQALANLLAN
ncbi:TlpA family protein disulfide reductase [Thalassotalea euphylliae]|uniref:TlpA family protein disulfide reductase n=2 Tax=Thalassotalea euphylliae TaxID=1655234 RepID=A0A3E0TWI3_9GAMM|nr:TlpA family protein disulfide reductase [Thalassotalea euphylliae]